MPTNAWGRGCSRPGVLNSLFGFLLFLLPINVLAQSPLIIGEVNWAGSSRSSADEWVELWNTSAEEQSLAGWSLEGASAQPLVFPEEAVVPAYGTFILSNYDEKNPKSALSASSTLVTTDVALSNETLHLILRNTQGVIMDDVGDGSKPKAGMVKPPTSMIRADIVTTIWMHSTSSYGLDPEAIDDLGTPGICDGCIRPEEPITDADTPFATESPPEPIVPEPETPSSPLPHIPDTSLSENATSTHTHPEEGEPTYEEPVFTETTSTDPEPFPEQTDELLPTPSSTLNVPEISAPSSTSPEEYLPEVYTPCTWRLQTIFPAPTDGQERITLTGCLRTEDLIGLTLHDAQGVVLTVTSSTTYQRPNEQEWELLLTSQRLNNSGDSVSLYAMDGRLLDGVTYPSMQHDEHYTRLEDGTWWIPERAPPITSSVNTPVSSTSPQTTSPPVHTSSSSVATSTVITIKKRGATSTPSFVTTSSTKTTSLFKKVTSMSWTEYMALKTEKAPSSKAATTKTTKPTPATKTIAKKTTSSPMITSLVSAPRVMLYGTVGTPPSLIAKRRFVLLNADGTGLLVYGSATQPSPPLGSSITIYGTLVTNDEGTHLEMKTKDRWELTKTPLAVPKTTSVDLLSVEPTQAWSLAEFTGRVLTRGTTSVRMETDGMELSVALPALLGYRAQRLQIGDIVRVRGVLDLRGARPQLYPRTPEEIVIVETKAATAAASTTSAPQNTLPPWAPLGTAAATIAGGYGFIRWRTWHKKKQLERQLTLAIEQLPS